MMISNWVERDVVPKKFFSCGQENMRGACNTHFFIYKKHKCKKHKARILLFSIVNLRNPVVNYKKLVDLDPIEMFLIDNKSVYMLNTRAGGSYFEVLRSPTRFFYKHQQLSDELSWCLNF